MNLEELFSSVLEMRGGCSLVCGLHLDGAFWVLADPMGMEFTLCGATLPRETTKLLLQLNASKLLNPEI